MTKTRRKLGKYTFETLTQDLPSMDEYQLRGKRGAELILTLQNYPEHITPLMMSDCSHVSDIYHFKNCTLMITGPRSGPLTLGIINFSKDEREKAYEGLDKILS